MASRATSASLCPGITWSNCMITSAPRLRSMRITLSGVKRRCEPSMWLRNSTPSSLDGAQAFQREHLEAAGVGEDRAVPLP